jgi:molybdopterin-guanine dinucleotide biosynthesis protein A
MKFPGCVPGYVQAGGGSTRFGSDKALIQLARKTMLQRSVDLLSTACDPVKIVAATGRYENPPAPQVADRWPGQGPLGGILTALQDAAGSQQPGSSVLPSPFVLIISCDMPFLTPDWLNFLCLRAQNSQAHVIVAESENGLEPLCACWRVDSAADIQSAFDSGVRKVTEAMKRLPMELLDVSVWKRFDTEGRLFWNMNTPADFAEARRIIETQNE